jgi:hypothetical protein
MDLRNKALAQLVFLTVWTTVCGPLSGLTMGLFVLVYRDGRRKGVLPPQSNQNWLPSWSLSRGA